MKVKPDSKYFVENGKMSTYVIMDMTFQNMRKKCNKQIRLTESLETEFRNLKYIPMPITDISK